MMLIAHVDNIPGVLQNADTNDYIIIDIVLQVSSGLIIAVVSVGFRGQVDVSMINCLHVYQTCQLT